METQQRLLIFTSTSTVYSPVKPLLDRVNEDAYEDVKIVDLNLDWSSKTKKLFFDYLYKFSPTTLIFFCSPISFLDYDDLYDLSSQYKLILYNADVPEYFENYFLPISSFFDLVLVDEILEVDRYLLYRVNARYFNHGFDKKLFYCSYEKNRKYDVTFVGRMDRANRFEILKYLSENKKLKTFIAGAGTENGFISVEKLADIYRNSKIVLNLTGISIKRPYSFISKKIDLRNHQLKGRIFEAMISGAMIISESCFSANRFFEDKRDYVEFSSISQLDSIINFYLENDHHRKKIASSGQSIAIEKYSDSVIKNELYSFKNIEKNAKYEDFISPIIYKRFMTRAIFQEMKFKNLIFSLKRISKYMNFFILADFSISMTIKALRSAKKIIFR